MMYPRQQTVAPATPRPLRAAAMIASIAALSTLLLASSASADDDAGRAKLAGKWQESDSNAESKLTWDFEHVCSSVRKTITNGAQKMAQYESNTVGKECTIEDAGRRTKVSLWFNGPKLVELETRGDHVVKRRFSVSDDGNTLEVETIPIFPAGKSETAHFTRVPATVAKQ